MRANQPMIGLKVQDVKVGQEVYYYEWADRYTNSKAEKATITSGPVEMAGGKLCCFIDIRNSVVALSNLSFECLPEKHLTEKQRRSKERYQDYIHRDLDCTFAEYIKWGLYKED